MEKVRIECRIPNASTRINGVRFGVVATPEKGPRHLLSEPITAAIAEGFCRSGRFALPADEYPVAILERIDREIGQARAADEAHGAGGEVGTLSRSVEELQRANQKTAADRKMWRERAEKAEAALASSSVPTLQAQVDQLAAENATLTRDNAAKDRQIEELRTINTQLATPMVGTSDAPPSGADATAGGSETAAEAETGKAGKGKASKAA